MGLTSCCQQHWEVNIKVVSLYIGWWHFLDIFIMAFVNPSALTNWTFGINWQNRWTNQYFVWWLSHAPLSFSFEALHSGSASMQFPITKKAHSKIIVIFGTMGSWFQTDEDKSSLLFLANDCQFCWMKWFSLLDLNWLSRWWFYHLLPVRWLRLILSVDWKLSLVDFFFFFMFFFCVSTDLIENENPAKKGIIQCSNNV